jgi:cbb3-type cytochrome c oxidase subunit III
MASGQETGNRSGGGGAVGLAAVAIGLVIVAVAITAWLVGRDSASSKTTIIQRSTTATTPAKTTVSPTVAAGAHDFVQFACAQCHGIGGVGGVSADVPSLNGLGSAFTVGQLTTIINHGLGESANPTKPYMPVWGAVISTRQVNELVAYLHAGLPAVSDATPVAVPQGQGLAVAGAALYVRDGCINCHGPNGLGGVPNPQAPDKAIPPLSGAGFRHDFGTDQKITQMIRTGSVLGRAPIVSMPHWGGIISNAHLTALVAYLKTLK